MIDLAKPNYRHHRIVQSPAAENADLSDGGIIDDLKLRGKDGDEQIRGALPCRGWKSILCRVKLVGGTAPTVTLQPLEVVKYKEGGDGAEKDEFAVLAANSGPHSDGDYFSLEVNGAHLFLRLNAVTGSPTAVELLVAGEERDLEALRVG